MRRTAAPTPADGRALAAGAPTACTDSVPAGGVRNTTVAATTEGTGIEMSTSCVAQAGGRAGYDGKLASGWGWTVREAVKYQWAVPSSCPSLPSHRATLRDLPPSSNHPDPGNTNSDSNSDNSNDSHDSNSKVNSSKRSLGTKKGTQGGGARAQHMGQPFQEFSPSEFCRRVGQNRTFLIIGDSISSQFAEALVNAMVLHLPKPATWAAPWKVLPECRDWLPPNLRPTYSGCRFDLETLDP